MDTLSSHALNGKPFCHVDIPTTSGIYVIHNQSTNDCYIGSATNLRRRYHEHSRKLFLGKHSNRHLQYAYTKYGESVFHFCIIEFVERKEDLIVREQYYLSFYTPTYNICPIAGSTLGRKLSEEAKEKIRQRQLGRKLSQEERTRMSESRKGKKHAPGTHQRTGEANAKRVYTPEMRQRMSLAHKGQHPSEEARKRMSEAQKGRKHSSESVERRSKTHIGKKRSLEARARMSEAQKKRVRSEEEIERVKNLAVGRKLTEENKANLRASFTPERREKLSIKMREYNLYEKQYNHRQESSTEIQLSLFDDDQISKAG